MPTIQVTIPISLETVAAIRAGHLNLQEGALSNAAADLSLVALNRTISAVKAIPSHLVPEPVENSFELQISDSAGRIIMVRVQVTGKITVKELAWKISRLTGLKTKQMILLDGKLQKIFDGAHEDKPKAHLADLDSVSGMACSCR